MGVAQENGWLINFFVCSLRYPFVLHYKYTIYAVYVKGYVKDFFVVDGKRILFLSVKDWKDVEANFFASFCFSYICEFLH